MTLEEKIDKMAKDIEELKAHLVPVEIKVMGCEHEYPTNWNSTALPSCIKCGKQYVYNGR